MEKPFENCNTATRNNFCVCLEKIVTMFAGENTKQPIGDSP